jgi:hypothetical protein
VTARTTARSGSGSDGDGGDGEAESDGIVTTLTGDRMRIDMDRVVVALFSGGHQRQQSQWRVGATSGGLGAAAGTTDGLSAEEPVGGPLSLPPDPLSAVAHPLEVFGPSSPPKYEAPPITGNEKRRLLAMLDEEAGREAFVHALNQQRSRRTEIGDAGFAELAAATAKVLDKCQQSRDVHTAKMAMMLSQTFYREVTVFPSGVATSHATLGAPGSAPSRETREYVKNAELLKEHPLWRDMKFWDEACWQSIAESLKEGHGSGADSWHAMGPLETRDAVLRVHNIVFSQVGAYAHSMVEFGCPPSLAKQFVRRLAATYQLGEDQKEMLLALARG